jgi:hypothetical protein
MRKIMATCMALVAFGSASQASAATLLYNLTGSRLATFTIDTATRPDTYNDVLGLFQQASYNNVLGTYNGVSGRADIVFGTTGFQILSPDLGFSQFISDTPLFSGNSIATTMLNTGTFALRSIVSGNSTLTVSRVAAAVPEVATWMMMLVGFGLVGGTMRHRVRKVSFR